MYMEYIGCPGAALGAKSMHSEKTLQYFGESDKGVKAKAVQLVAPPSTLPHLVLSYGLSIALLVNLENRV